MSEKKIYKSQTDRVIFGVAGGIGEYFGVDSIIVRLIFILLTLWGGAGVLFYIIAAIIIPEAPGYKKDKKSNVEEGEVVDGKKAGDNRKDFSEKTATAAQQIKTDFTDNPRKGSQIFGAIILFLGLVFLGQIFFPWFEMDKLWPVALILIGLFLLFGIGRRDK